MTLYERDGEDINRGLVGYYKLNDKRVSTSTAIDYAKFNDGVITGATNTTGINGLNPDAMLFNGSTGVVDISSLNLGKIYCLSLWIKTTGTSATFIASSADVNVFLGISGSLVFVKIAGGDQASITGTGDVVDGKFHHVLINRNGTSYEVFMDGEFKQTVSLSSNIDFVFSRIAMRKDGFFPLAGTLQKIRVYNRNLTHGEASKLHRLRL